MCKLETAVVGFRKGLSRNIRGHFGENRKKMYYCFVFGRGDAYICILTAISLLPLVMRYLV